MKKKIKKRLSVLVILTLTLGYIFIYFYPVPLFANRVDFGKYTVYSDLSISSQINPILDTVENRLQSSELYEPISHNIAISNNTLRFIFLANKNYSALAVTQPLSNFVLLSKTDIENDKVTSLRKTNNTSSLSHTLAHELTHTLINKAYPFKHFIIPSWKQEGYCEYIANGSSYDTEKGIYNFLEDIQDSSLSYEYFKNRLRITYLMDVKELSFVDIVDMSFEKDQLDTEIKEYLRLNKKLI